MGFIKVGNRSVEVIAEIALTGTMAANSDGAAPSEAANYVTKCGINPAWFDDYGANAAVGYAAAHHGEHFTQMSMTGGRTGLEDYSEMIVDTPVGTPPGTMPLNDQTWTSTVTIEREGIALVADQTLKYIDAVGSLASQLTRKSKMFAVAYYWSAETDPAYSTDGYYVFVIEKDVRLSGTTFAALTGIYIDIPYINKTQGLHLMLGETPEPTPEDLPFDPSDDSPYAPDPSHDDTSDLIDIPTSPAIGVSSIGFVNVYNPGANALRNLGDILFPNVASATDVLDALLKICESLANSRLIDYVIDCHVIPVSPTTGANANIKVGFNNTGISVPTVASDYVDVSCGSLNIAEYFNGFQDYLCTVSKIFLPFIGFVDTKPEYWQAGTISVDYKFNVIDGSFMCYIRSVSSKSQLNGSVIASYGGNACMHIPITGVNYANMISGVIGAVTAPVQKNSPVSPVLGAAYSVANTVAAGGDVQQSNGYNSTSAMLGVRTPYMIIERPAPSYSAKYRHDKGYPSNIAAALSSVSGFTVIEDIDLSGIPFCQDELNELRQLLSEGVYF